MKKIYPTFFGLTQVLFGLFLLGACRQNVEKRTLESISLQLKERKIKRVTEAQIVGFAYEKGQQISTLLNKSLNENLKNMDFDCQKIAFEDIHQRYEFLAVCQLRCDSLGLVQDKERQVWQAYQYKLTQKESLSDNVQKISETDYLFTSPFFWKGQFKGVWWLVMSKKELVKNI